MELQRRFVGMPDRVWPAGAKHWGYGHGSGRPDMGDFVPGGWPLPWNPVFADSGIGDFVWGGFPLPQNPVGIRASAYGALPKSPDIPMALIGHGNGADLDDGDCGMGYYGQTQSDMIRGFSGVGYAGDSQSDMIRGFSGVGDCGCGGSCGGCGMGALEVPLWAKTLPAPLNGEVAGIPTVYLAGGVLALVFILPMMGGRKGRR